MNKNMDRLSIVDINWRCQRQRTPSFSSHSFPFQFWLQERLDTACTASPRRQNGFSWVQQQNLSARATRAASAAGGCPVLFDVACVSTSGWKCVAAWCLRPKQVWKNHLQFREKHGPVLLPNSLHTALIGGHPGEMIQLNVEPRLAKREADWQLGFNFWENTRFWENTHTLM